MLAAPRRTGHVSRLERRLVPRVVAHARVENWRSCRESDKTVHHERVFNPGELSADGSRTKPRGTALKGRAVSLSVNCQESKGLRRLDSHIAPGSEDQRATSGGGFDSAFNVAISLVGGDGDGDVAVRVDTVRRSANDARRRWQAVSE